jgi:hypothetical protein
MRDYFDKPEHLGKTVYEFARDLGVNTERVRIRPRRCNRGSNVFCLFSFE